MDINTVIKISIQDPELRKSLIERPVETCRRFGIEPCGLAEVRLVSDASSMQGGYRP